MGAWNYMAPRLASLVNADVTIDVISRPERSSPATGFWDVYQVEQEQIIAEALHSSIKQIGGQHVR